MNKLEIKKFAENLDFPVNGSTEKKNRNYRHIENPVKHL